METVIGAAERSGVCAEGCTNVELGRVASKEMSFLTVCACQSNG